MNFIDQVDLESTASRSVLDVVEQIPRIVNFRLRRRIHFYQVNKTPLINFFAGAALTTRLGRNSCFAIQRFGQDASYGGLADTSRSREKIGVMQPLAIQRISERFEHMLLPHRFSEILWSPLSGEYR